MLRLNVDATNRTTFVKTQPLIDARDVEQMHAGKTPNILVLLKFAQTNRALVNVIVGFFIVVLAFLIPFPGQGLEAVWESAAFDAVFRRAMIADPASTFQIATVFHYSVKCFAVSLNRLQQH